MDYKDLQHILKWKKKSIFLGLHWIDMDWTFIERWSTRLVNFVITNKTVTHTFKHQNSFFCFQNYYSFTKASPASPYILITKYFSITNKQH